MTRSKLTALFLAGAVLGLSAGPASLAEGLPAEPAAGPTIADLITADGALPARVPPIRIQGNAGTDNRMLLAAIAVAASMRGVQGAGMR